MESILLVIALLLFIGLIAFIWAVVDIIGQLSRIAEALEGEELPLSTTELERRFRENLGRGDPR